MREYTISGTLTGNTAIHQSILAAADTVIVGTDAITLNGVGTDAVTDNLFVTTDTDVTGLYNQVIIGTDESGTINASPVVHFVSGTDTGDVSVNNGSRLNVQAGDLRGTVTLEETGEIVVSGGTINRVESRKESTVTIEGGNVGSIIANDNAKITVNGGTITTAEGYGTVTTILDGNVTNADMNSSLSTGSNGELNIEGGLIRRAYGRDTSVVNIRGGTIDLVLAADSSTISITGGNITEISGGSTSTINLRGGQIAPNTIRLNAFSVLNVFGTGLTLISTGFGTDFVGDYQGYSLVGLLEDGQRLDFVTLRDYIGGYDILNGGPGTSALYFNGVAQSVVAPEPGSVALLLMGLPGLAVLAPHRTFLRPKK